MNLSNTIEHKYPFKHWEFFNCLDNLTLDEIEETSKLCRDVISNKKVTFKKQYI